MEDTMTTDSTPARHRTRRLLLAIAASAALVAAAAPALAAHGGSKHRTVVQHWYGHQVSFVYTRADGTVVMPPPDQPSPGDRIEFTQLDYRGTHAHHARHWTMSDHTICTFQAAGPPLCDGQAAVKNSLILFRTDAAGTIVSGGTGRYAGATGNVQMTEIGDTNDSDFVLTLHLR
jgi:hypothetical protein